MIQHNCRSELPIFQESQIVDHLFEIVNGLMSSTSGYISSFIAPLFSSLFKLELPSWEAFHLSASACI